MKTQTLTDVTTNAVVYIVTHDEKFSTPNPGMTKKGKEHIASLIGHLPSPELFEVVCGSGRRHLDVAEALGLTITICTPSVGGPDSLEVIDEQKFVVLSDGTKIPHAQYSLNGQDAAAKKVVNNLESNTIICAGRPLLINLGVEGGKSGAVYRITGDQIEMIADGHSVGAGKNEV